MSLEICETVSSTFIEVVEQLTYIFGDPAEKSDLDPTEGEYLYASMGFNGDLEGAFGVAVSRELVDEIASNILGLEPGDEIDDLVRSDALKEVVNVVCGHLVVAVGPDDMFFTLVPPVTKMLTEVDLGELLDDPDTMVVMMEESPVLLEFRLTKEPVE